MKLPYRNAPAHAIRVCAGVFVLCALIAGCENVPRIGSSPRALELEGDTIQLESGVRLHDVSLRATQAGDFEPAEVSARSGDIVRFVSADTRTHALSIRAPNDQAKGLLDAAGQLRSPPLVARGQTWVVSLKGLPAGTYTVSCISHAGTATIQVQ